MKTKKNVQERQKEFKDYIYTNYNMGWAKALIKVIDERNFWDKTAIFYRGTKYTYREMIEKGYEYAHSMEAIGLNKDSVIPLCTSHCPEEIFTIIGASLIGAQITPIGEHFNEEYFIERINKKGTPTIFMTDDKYEELKNVLPETIIDKIVMFSVMDSYPKNNPYKELEVSFFDGINRVQEYKSENGSIIDKKTFLQTGEKHFQEEGFVEAERTLDDIFSITYSSGTTNSNKPKPIVHNISTYVGMGIIRAQETPDLNKFSKNGEIKALVHIPIYSNTSLLASISDELFLGGTLCLEHIYDERFFPISLLINRPNLAIATPSHWLSGMKELTTNPAFRNADLKCLMAAFTAGEPTSAGEEKFINQCFKKLHASDDFPAFKMINALGMGAGDCENCGLWRMPHRATMERLKKIVNFTKKNVSKGYETYSVVDWSIINERGENCKPNERGLLTINSPFTMVGYDDMPEETQSTKIYDANGNLRTNCKLWSYYDEMGEVFVKGRYNKDIQYPTYLIDDEICKDTKNIMSSTVVQLEDGTYVAHITFQPNSNRQLESIEARLRYSIPEEILKRLVYKVRPFQYSYPLTGSGKRSATTLASEGLTGTVKPINETIVSGSDYIENLSKKDKQLTMKK